MAATYSPGSILPVPSAMMGLTALFGMGRGEHHRQDHHKILKIKLHIGKKALIVISILDTNDLLFFIIVLFYYTFS